MDPRVLLRACLGGRRAKGWVGMKAGGGFLFLGIEKFLFFYGSRVPMMAMPTAATAMAA